MTMLVEDLLKMNGVLLANVNILYCTPCIKSAQRTFLFYMIFWTERPYTMPKLVENFLNKLSSLLSYFAEKSLERHG